MFELKNKNIDVIGLSSNKKKDKLNKLSKCKIVSRDIIDLESEFNKNREAEVLFAKQLTEKYGKGSLDISTGIFTPAE